MRMCSVIRKLKVQKLTEKMAPLAGKNVFMCAATLRPETMPGQTNCFVLPDGEYGAYEVEPRTRRCRHACNSAHHFCQSL